MVDTCSFECDNFGLRGSVVVVGSGTGSGVGGE